MGWDEDFNLDCEELLGLGVGLSQCNQAPLAIDTHSKISDMFIGQTA